MILMIDIYSGWSGVRKNIGFIYFANNAGLVAALANRPHTVDNSRLNIRTNVGQGHTVTNKAMITVKDPTATMDTIERTLTRFGTFKIDQSCSCPTPCIKPGLYRNILLNSALELAKSSFRTEISTDRTLAYYMLDFSSR